MHCRIGYRQNGGFIECFDDSATINVAGIDKNRSRLTNGDILKIGLVGIEVVIPQSGVPATVFDIAFDDDDTKTVETSDALASAVEQPQAFSDTSATEPQQAVTETLTAPDKAPTDLGTLTETDLDDSTSYQTESITPSKDNDNAPALENEATFTQDESDRPSSDSSGSVKSADKPVFEFDSVDPADIKITEEDLDVIENMTGNSLVLQDFDAMVAETFPDHLRNQSVPQDTSEPQPPEPASPDSDKLIPGGSDTGKCCRWTGKTVLSVVEFIEQRCSSLQCFDIEENVNLINCSFADIKHAVANKNGPKIFLLTEKSQNDLRRFFTAKRWNERLGHPQALSMFLTLLPAKNIKLLFAEIDACVLVQNNDIELVRLSRDLEK